MPEQKFIREVTGQELSDCGLHSLRDYLHAARDDNRRRAEQCAVGRDQGVLRGSREELAMTIEAAHPMIPFLAGWLAGVLDKDGRSCMKIVEVEVTTRNGFDVTFASGARLAVRINQVQEERTQ